MAVDGTVIGVYPQGSRPTVVVSFNDGARVRCDVEHLWAVTTKERHGVWGGLSSEERASAVDWLDVDPGLPRAEHGDYSRYTAGCTDGPDGGSCERCKAAKRRYAAEYRQRLRRRVQGAV